LSPDIRSPQCRIRLRRACTRGRAARSQQLAAAGGAQCSESRSPPAPVIADDRSEAIYGNRRVVVTAA
jgi:hypothetical protein